MRCFAKQILSQTAASKIWQGFWNRIWLQKQMEIKIIKLWVNSKKIITKLKKNIPWRLKLQAVSNSWQHRQSVSIFIVEQFLHLHQTLGSQSFPINISGSMSSPSSLISWYNPSWLNTLLSKLETNNFVF